MNIPTGQTVYEQIISVNLNNTPVTGVTFDTAMYKDGASYTGLTISTTLTDASRGIYTAEWSASTTGNYQLYAKNDITSIVFMSDSVIVKTDEELNTNVYIGI